MAADERVQFSEDFDLPPGAMLEAACRIGLEGVIAKREDAPYVSERSDTWLKLKCSQRQEFVVVGFTDRAGSHGEVGGLLLGYHEGGALRYAGSVGTGWDAKTGRELHARLARLEVDKPALDATQPSNPGAGRAARRAASAGCGRNWWPRWRSPNGHPTAMCGIRRSRSARGQAGAGDHARARRPRHAAHRARRAGVRVTNPERVIDPVDRPHQGRPGALLRKHRRLDPAAPEEPTGVAGARADRHRRRAVLPEAPREPACPA